jgi:hypothetical protein
MATRSITASQLRVAQSRPLTLSGNSRRLGFIHVGPEQIGMASFDSSILARIAMLFRAKRVDSRHGITSQASYGVV